MAYSHRDVIQAQAEHLAAQRARALSDYEVARLSEDNDATMNAADQIVEIDARAAALDRIAGNFVRQQQQPQQPGSRYGLSRDEVEVAKISGISEEQYARNRQKMHQMKSEGYWSQGRVFK